MAVDYGGLSTRLCASGVRSGESTGYHSSKRALQPSKRTRTRPSIQVGDDSRSSTTLPCLNGQRRWNRRLWRWLARAPEVVAGRPVAGPLPGSAKLPRAARCALTRHRSPAGALPRRHFDHAAVQDGAFSVDRLVRVRVRDGACR
eukprot:scaffold11735_cov56-Phaeocystis_antarctica.AAC.2